MKRRSSAGTIASLILVCIFGATLLLSLAAGASVYRQVAERVEAGAHQRVGLTYITAKLHGADSLEQVSCGDFGGEQALFLEQAENGTVYETILYVHDGWLMELLREQGTELTPDDGQTITEAQSLSISEPEPGLLRLDYVDGAGQTQSTDVYLRSR